MHTTGGMRSGRRPTQQRHGGRHAGEGAAGASNASTTSAGGQAVKWAGCVQHKDGTERTQDELAAVGAPHGAPHHALRQAAAAAHGPFAAPRPAATGTAGRRWRPTAQARTSARRAQRPRPALARSPKRTPVCSPRLQRGSIGRSRIPWRPHPQRPHPTGPQHAASFCGQVGTERRAARGGAGRGMRRHARQGRARRRRQGRALEEALDAGAHASATRPARQAPCCDEAGAQAPSWLTPALPCAALTGSPGR